MTLIFFDFACSFRAEADCAFRVSARISKSAFTLSKALMTELPCFPVAPVMRSAFVIWSICELK